MVRQIERDASVTSAERLDTDPDNLASRRDRIEVRGVVPVDAGREYFGFEDGCRERCALKLLDGVK